MRASADEQSPTDRRRLERRPAGQIKRSQSRSARAIRRMRGGRALES